MDSLISLLSNEKYPDLDFQKTFLLTYRSFMSTRELLQKLILRYCLTPGPSCPMDIETAKSRWQIPVRLRVLNFIRSWVEGYYELDFVVRASERLSTLKGARWMDGMSLLTHRYSTGHGSAADAA